MKKFFKLITIIGSFALITFAANAQQYGSTTIWGAVGTNLVPSTAYTLTVTDGFFPVTDYEDFAITVSCSWSNPAACWNGAGDQAEALQMVFYPAIAPTAAGTVTNYAHTCIFVCNTNWVYPRVTYGTNFTDFPYGYMKLAYVSNALTIAHATNIVFQLTTKPRKREYR